MIYAVVVLTALSAALLIVGAANVAPAQSRLVKRRLAALQTGATTHRELQERRRRQAKRDRIEGLLQALGEKVAREDARTTTRTWLVHGGFRHGNAAAIYTAIRVLLAIGLGLTVFLSTAVALPARQMYVLTAIAALLGWMAPFIWVNRRVKKRQLVIRRVLPDTLDLLGVCVEAGLGLNQALLRVAEEVDRICPEMGDELTITNFEIRAGTPRDEALKSLGDRTGVDDLRALTSMLVQSDRFGTSIANSLRVHAEMLRTKRMQLAEEAAAKTTVKILFPLIFFIFPAIFVVLLGPSFFVFRDLFGAL